MPGYSGTPLAKKLGYTAGARVAAWSGLTLVIRKELRTEP